MNPSRRALLRSTAWGVPAVSIAAAAPSFATSGTPALAFAEFAMTPMLGFDSSDWFYDVAIDALTVSATGNGAAQRVTVSIDFVPDGGSNAGRAGADLVGGWSVPSGWFATTIPADPRVVGTFHFMSSASVTSTTPVRTGRVPLAFGTFAYRVVGVFAVTASASGYTPVTQTFRTGPVPPQGHVVAGQGASDAATVTPRLHRSR